MEWGNCPNLDFRDFTGMILSSRAMVLAYNDLMRALINIKTAYTSSEPVAEAVIDALRARGLIH
ncbi:hypothetical protein [Vreelandella salicampi]|uniref:Uncharacterized protein n=1 Tax=Vreelandella salicampi TaxID=1449798 RepID=A0A7Z0LIQ6_9GAMM|nr:hypothetical protein [Halomonas salicampi]NYS59726.1 hypothetical protein [Halomonas salicampi]